MNNINDIKRNYFVIGSILTFFVVGGATLYAKTDGDLHEVTRIFKGEDSSQNAAMETEIELEHGTIATATVPHASDDTRVSTDSPKLTEDRSKGDDDDGYRADRRRGRDDDEDEEDGDDEDDDERSWANPTVTNPTPTTPVPSPSPAVASKTFTLAEVATHKDASSCYTTINGGVYDVTTYIPVHKGGSAAILAICGKDGSSLFGNQHGGAPKPEQALASFKIGILAQ